MLQLSSAHDWTPSKNGFLIGVGAGATRAVIEVEGLRFPEYRERYLNLALNIVPVLSLALTNASNYQLLQNQQAELRSAVAGRDNVLAVVSHDLKNPLLVVQLSAEALNRVLSKKGLDANTASLIRSILSASGRMQRLIEDLLDMSMIEAGEFRIQRSMCSAEEILHEALREVRLRAEKKQIQVETRYSKDIRIECDRGRIVQVLGNLLGNAFKFAPDREGRISTGFEEKGGAVLFFVSDNGPGIAAEELPHIFDRFWKGQQKQSGAGLGLAISEGIVRAHQGEIWAESAVGRGTSVYFTIPRSSKNNV